MVWALDYAESHEHRTDNRRCFLLLFGNRTEQLSLVVLQLIQQEKELLVVLRCQNPLSDLSLATGLPLPRFRRSQLIQQVGQRNVLQLGCGPSVDLGSQVQLEVGVVEQMEVPADQQVEVPAEVV